MAVRTVRYVQAHDDAIAAVQRLATIGARLTLAEGRAATQLVDELHKAIRTVNRAVGTLVAETDIALAVTPESLADLERVRELEALLHEPPAGDRCRNGHRWTERTLYMSARGEWVCRTCRNAYNRRLAASKREAA